MHLLIRSVRSAQASVSLFTSVPGSLPFEPQGPVSPAGGAFRFQLDQCQDGWQNRRMLKLKSCPFCGGPHLKTLKVFSEDEPTHQIAWQVFCETCHAHGPAAVRIGWCETEADAQAAWNRRSPRPIEDPAMTPAEELARDIRAHFLGVAPDAQDHVLEDADYQRILDALEAVRVAQQLASIASDWNLDEVEIDGEMRDTGDLTRQFNAVLNN